jgi:hypothetical protein
MAMPDVNKTPAPPGPPVPIPYPNIAQANTATGTCPKVLIENKETVVDKSKIPSSDGGAPGTAGGVQSGVNSKATTFRGAASNVYCGPDKLVRVTDVTDQNDLNAKGQQMSPSQMKVVAGP